MGPTFRRVVIWGALTALLAAGLIHAFTPQSVPVDMGAIDRGVLQVTVDDEGRTKVKDIYVVSSPVVGRALRIEIEVGDPVIAGAIAGRDGDLLDSGHHPRRAHHPFEDAAPAKVQQHLAGQSA